MAQNYKTQTRIWIGPPYTPATDATHYDWSQIDAGDTDFEDSHPRGQLNASLSDTATSVNYGLVTPGRTFPPAGGVWIGPTGPATGWEYISYTSNSSGVFGGITRQNIAEMEHGGLHGIGAQIYQFYPLTEDADDTLEPTASGEIHVTKRLEKAGAVEDWSAVITGYNLPRHAIRNHHMVVVERRLYGQDGPDSWQVWLVGWLQSPNGQDTAQRAASWSAEIVSISQMLNRYEIAGIDVGPRDIAKDGSASASTPLSFAYKERTSGDYTAADPDFDARSVLDRDRSTLWIADQYVGDRNYLPSNGDPHWNGQPATETRFIISVVYLRRPLGLPSRGYRFIELTIVEFGGETVLKDHYFMTEANGQQLLLDIGENDVAEGNKIILCEDQSLWQEENPVNGAEQIHELPISFFDGIDADADTIALVRKNSPYAWSHGVSWGRTGTPPKPDPTPAQFVWQGSTQLGAAPYGYALRYMFKGSNGLGNSADASDYWEYSKVVSPGYTIGEYGTDDNRWNAGKITPVWIQVDLPELQLVLSEDLASATDGPGILHIEDSAETPSTQGLDLSGYLQIAEEIIGYDYKTAEGINIFGRARFGTERTAHKAGDTVMVRDPETGFATTAPVIKSIDWSRPDGLPYPAHFALYTSIYERLRHPDNEQWQDDWILRSVVSGWTPGAPDENDMITWTYNFPTPRRVKSLLIVIYQMSTDPYRPRVNEIFAQLNDEQYSDDSWLNDGESAGQAIAALFSKAGLAGSAYTIQAGTLAPQGYTVEAGFCWSVVADVADYTNTRITVGLDSKIIVAANTLWTAASHAADYTWRRNEIADLSISQPAPAPIRQIEMVYYISPAGEETTVVYPAPDDAPKDGEIQTVGRQVYGSDIDAQRAATRRYNYARWPYTAVAELAALQTQTRMTPEPRPGEFAVIEWEFGPHETEYARYSRTHLIDSVDIFVDDDGATATTVALTQIDRTSYE